MGGAARMSTTATRRPGRIVPVMGTLTTAPARTRPDLLAAPVLAALERWPAGGPVPVDDVLVAPIDPGLADTAEFCAAYGIGLDVSANCVVVAGRRSGE